MSIVSFSDFLAQDVCQQVAPLFKEKRLLIGETLFDYEEASDTFYFLQEGRLSVQKFTGFQEKMQVVALLDSGAVVSEAALLDGHVHQTRVVAVEDSLLLCLEGKKFTQLKASNPDVAHSFLEIVFSIVSLRLEKTSARLAHIL